MPRDTMKNPQALMAATIATMIEAVPLGSRLSKMPAKPQSLQDLIACRAGDEQETEPAYALHAVPVDVLQDVTVGARRDEHLHRDDPSDGHHDVKR